MINWKVRLKNKQFWTALIPMVFLLVQQILKVFGIEYDGTDMANALVAIIGTLFAILALSGIVADPTTKGFGDSEQALTYEQPKQKGA
ncbi:phage holin [Ileibacterium valens]|uniref:Phage holin n=1 Tax=Ileibacterium valens TaxID=1862668 RepID=A0A1U7NHI1_9FIRM|nr:phage holin [Ileibacterium valens]OLU39727.1 phage holin [Erysipelotrichaceae bacterium NYU-BL-E8]OLU39967.1 phage holin [Erysipelotrichaceae bacterium NYU-BL-F16]OLU41294.1 phage holin [Ileibacterium valens]